MRTIPVETGNGTPKSTVLNESKQIYFILVGFVQSVSLNLLMKQIVFNHLGKYRSLNETCVGTKSA